MSLAKPNGATARARASGPIRTVLIFMAASAVAMIFMIMVDPARVLSQGAALVRVDIAVVSKGYRVSKLLNSNVVNEKNERIGSLDDIIVGRDRELFAVLQVGGFLGLGGKLVAVPYESLKLDDEGRRIELPGATKEELQKLTEFQYRT